MKITKKEFVEKLTGNKSVFCGLSKRLYAKEELETGVRGLLKDIKAGNHVEMRSCKARSRDLLFSGGSHLDINGRTFGKYEYDGATVYTCHEEEILHGSEKYEKTMYYLIAD